MATYTWKSKTNGVKNRVMFFKALKVVFGNIEYRTWDRKNNIELFEGVARALHPLFEVEEGSEFSLAAFVQQYRYLKQADTSNIKSNLLPNYKETVEDAFDAGIFEGNFAALEAIFNNFSKTNGEQ